MNGILKSTTPYVRDGDGEKVDRTRYARHHIISETREHLVTGEEMTVVMNVEDCDWYGGTIDDRLEIVMTPDEAIIMAIQLLNHAREAERRNCE